MTQPMQSYRSQHSTRETEEFITQVKIERQKAQEEARKRERDHYDHLCLVRAVIELYRLDVGIEPVWDIEVRIVCPDDLPDAEASIWWNEQTWYARLMMRCDAPEDLVYYLVVHELYELAHWRTGNVFRYLMYYAPQDEHSQFLLEEHLRARNQEIEVQVRKFLGDEKRPYHLNGPFEYCNPHGIALHDEGTSTSTSTSTAVVKGKRREKERSPVQKVRFVRMDEPLAIYDCPTTEMPALLVGAIV